VYVSGLGVIVEMCFYHLCFICHWQLINKKKKKQDHTGWWWYCCCLLIARVLSHIVENTFFGGPI